MNKEFIPYEQALELKELGFIDDCIAWYSDERTLSFDIDSYNKNFYSNVEMHKEECSAPLYQQAFRWFREKYNLFHSVYPIGISTGGKDSYRWRWAAPAIIGEDIIYTDESDLGFLNYEEAELACLKKLIKIVKQK